jgi:GxxExxY protein
MPIGDTISPGVERVASVVTDSIFKVHQHFRPRSVGVSVQDLSLSRAAQSWLRVRKEVEVPVVYGGVRLDAGFRIDLLVEECVIIETKAVEKMNPICEAQLLTYLRLMNLRLGFLVNFNVTLIKDGIKRMIV